MTANDLKRYSITKAIREIAFNGGRVTGLEKEMSDEAARQRGVDAAPGSFTVPEAVFRFQRETAMTATPFYTRDQLVGTASIGGNLRPTEHMGGAFIDILRNKMILAAAGARYMPGLVGTVVIPRRLTGATVAHVTEAQSITESQGTFDQVTLTPKCAAGYVQYSIDLLKQSSPVVDQLVADDLTLQVNTDMEAKILHGSGSGGQPTGLASVAGTTVTGGTHGSAPDWADIVALESAVAVNNADSSPAYLMNTAVRGKLRVTPLQSSGVEGSFVWDQKTPDRPVNGTRTLITNNVASNLTKGTSTTVCSAIFYGNFSDLLVGTWGGVDLLVDPYSNAQTRLVNVRAFQYYDATPLRPNSFAVMLDALTT